MTEYGEGGFLRYKHSFDTVISDSSSSSIYTRLFSRFPLCLLCSPIYELTSLFCWAWLGWCMSYPFSLAYSNNVMIERVTKPFLFSRQNPRKEAMVAWLVGGGEITKVQGYINSINLEFPLEIRATKRLQSSDRDMFGCTVLTTC